MLLNEKIHRILFLFGLALSLCALPFSPFALSVGQIILVANWLLEGSWSSKLNRIQHSRSLWIFCLVYLSIVIGVFYSSNFGYAIKELRLWLPILLLPIVVATSSPLTRKELKTLLLLFCAAVFVATLIGLGIYLKKFSLGSQNVRKISPFISHIRLALMVCFSIFILGYLAFKKGYLKSYFIKAILFVIALWFITFLFILQSFTGIIILGIVFLVLAIISISRITDVILKFSLIVGFVSVILIGFFYLAHTVDGYFTRNKVDFKSLPVVTVNGNLYTHDTISRQYENRNLVWINICYPELSRGWNKVSKLPYDAVDGSGQSVKLSLIRYLTSKGLRKDSVGISQLDSVDIRLIENSVASVIYREHKVGIYPRLYQTLWEIDSYRTRDAIGGSSLVQRGIYLKASIHIIKNNFFFGVGTGDGPETLYDYYRTSSTDLQRQFWLLSHNEFITVWIASGVFGCVFFLIGLLYPFFSEKRYKFYLCLVFQLIILASMLNEDTFETHIGISFAALFYAILFFGFDFSLDKQE